MKKIAALLIMSAMAGQVVADTVAPGVIGGKVAATNALGLTTLTTVGIVAGVTGAAIIAGSSNGSSSTNSTASTATNNNL